MAVLLELAAMTGLNENTVKIKLFRTRKKLLAAAQRLGKRQILRSNLFPAHASSPRGAAAIIDVITPST